MSDTIITGNEPLTDKQLRQWYEYAHDLKTIGMRYGVGHPKETEGVFCYTMGCAVQSLVQEVQRLNGRPYLNEDYGKVPHE